MRLKAYDERDGKRVWLSRDELEMLIDQAEGWEQEFAFKLAARVGLRRSEITRVAPKDFVDGPTGTHVRIWEDYAKQDHYREPPVPGEMTGTVNVIGEQNGPADPIIDRDPSTVYRWVRRAAEALQEETGDEGWQLVDVHDLRRTWGTDLLEQGVLPSVVMEWGGWRDWDTFRKHYLGEFSPGAIQRERQKVDFLDGAPGVETESETDLLYGRGPMATATKSSDYGQKGEQ